MSSANSEASTRTRPLRLWPGVVIVALQWLLRFALPAVAPGTLHVGVFAGLGGGLAVAIWWVAFSRAAWVERLGAVVLTAVALAATPAILHPSIATGMMGMMFPFYAIPVLSLAFVGWAVATRGLPTSVRRLTMAATILLACGGWALVRTGGFTPELDNDFAWRWSPTAEERLLARSAGRVQAAPAAAAAVEPGTAPEWPGYRGPRRDGVVRGALLATDWGASPPVELWRRAVGPGWSSFAVWGGLFYTQEQRGDDEVVSCYDLATGEPVWRHADAARFWEANAGAGPRATPVVHEGRVAALGATGLLNLLDARTGAVVWSLDAASDLGVELPGWGFAGSPLFVDDLVIVALAGRLGAYDVETGARRWAGPARGGGYSSPHRLTIDGVEQVVLLAGQGPVGVDPTDGTPLWTHDWPGASMVQPQLTDSGDLVIAAAEMSGVGTRRLAVRRRAGDWSVDELWTSRGLKPYFNAFVVHEGHAYGFDGGILSAIDVESGERVWKGGRYGYGQLLLLPDQDLLLVLSEQGELALVAAAPDRFTEIARAAALEGKTWNHPALVGDLLLVRNSQEMAAFRLARQTAG